MTIENWKRTLDENFQIGTILMDLSKAFDRIPHDLLIAKLYAYGLSEEKNYVFLPILKKKRSKSQNRRHPKLFASFDLWSTPRVYPQLDLF